MPSELDVSISHSTRHLKVGSCWSWFHGLASSKPMPLGLFYPSPHWSLEDCPSSRHHVHLQGKKKGESSVASAVSFSIIGENKSIPATSVGVPLWFHGWELCHVAIPGCRRLEKQISCLFWGTLLPPNETGVMLAKREKWIPGRQVQCLSQGPRSRPGSKCWQTSTLKFARESWAGCPVKFEYHRNHEWFFLSISMPQILHGNTYTKNICLFWNSNWSVCCIFIC